VEEPPPVVEEPEPPVVVGPSGPPTVKWSFLEQLFSFFAKFFKKKEKVK
jgi:hypothetical protein